MSDDAYEVNKIIKSWDLGYNLGHALKYIVKYKEGSEKPIDDLRKARFFIDRHIRLLNQEDEAQ